MDIAGFEDVIDLSQPEWSGKVPFPGMDGVEFLVRSPNYAPFVRARDAAMRDISMKQSEGGAEAEEFWIATAEQMARHLVTDWRGVKLNGKDAEFTEELAVRLFTAKDPHGIGERFRKALDFATSMRAANLFARREEISGNSQKP